MAVVLYRVKVRKVIRVKKVKTKVRVNALPFMPFYDSLCPLALSTAKVIRVKKVKTEVRINALPFMPFYDALCPLAPDNEKGQKRSQGSKR